MFFIRWGIDLPSDKRSVRMCKDSENIIFPDSALRFASELEYKNVINKKSWRIKIHE